MQWQGWVVAMKTTWPTKPNLLLSGPLQKKFANPWHTLSLLFLFLQLCWLSFWTWNSPHSLPQEFCSHHFFCLEYCPHIIIWLTPFCSDLSSDVTFSVISPNYSMCHSSSLTSSLLLPLPCGLLSSSSLLLLFISAIISSQYPLLPEVILFICLHIHYLSSLIDCMLL